MNGVVLDNNGNAKKWGKKSKANENWEKANDVGIKKVRQWLFSWPLFGSIAFWVTATVAIFSFLVYHWTGWNVFTPMPWVKEQSELV